MFGRNRLEVDKAEVNKSGWIEGTINPGGYTFHAEVWAKPSRYGIDEGRISKLTVKDEKGEEVVNYNRGFPERDTDKHYKLTNEQINIIKAVKERFPTGREWTPEEQAKFKEIEAREDKAELERASRPPTEQTGDNSNPMGFFENKNPGPSPTREEALRFYEDWDKDRSD